MVQNETKRENRVEGGKEEAIQEQLDNIKLSKTLETGVSGEKNTEKEEEEKFKDSECQFSSNEKTTNYDFKKLRELRKYK